MRLWETILPSFLASQYTLYGSEFTVELGFEVQGLGSRFQVVVGDASS